MFIINVSMNKIKCRATNAVQYEFTSVSPQINILDLSRHQIHFSVAPKPVLFLTLPNLPTKLQNKLRSL